MTRKLKKILLLIISLMLGVITVGATAGVIVTLQSCSKNKPYFTGTLIEDTLKSDGSGEAKIKVDLWNGTDFSKLVFDGNSTGLILDATDNSNHEFVIKCNGIIVEGLKNTRINSSNNSYKSQDIGIYVTANDPDATKSLSANVSGSLQFENVTKTTTITVEGFNGATLPSGTFVPGYGLSATAWTPDGTNKVSSIISIGTATTGDKTITISTDGITTTCTITVIPAKSISASIDGSVIYGDTTTTRTITLNGYNGVDFTSLAVPSNSAFTFASSWTTVSTTQRTITVKWASGTAGQNITIMVDGCSTSVWIAIQPSGSSTWTTLLNSNFNWNAGVSVDQVHASYNADLSILNIDVSDWNINVSGVTDYILGTYSNTLPVAAITDNSNFLFWSATMGSTALDRNYLVGSKIDTREIHLTSSYGNLIDMNTNSCSFHVSLLLKNSFSFPPNYVPFDVTRTSFLKIQRTLVGGYDSNNRIGRLEGTDIQLASSVDSMDGLFSIPNSIPIFEQNNYINFHSSTLNLTYNGSLYKPNHTFVALWTQLHDWPANVSFSFTFYFRTA